MWIFQKEVFSLYYNLSSFGSKVKQIRKKLSLTQSDVSKSTHISENTLCRIELGQVLPKHDTLDLLSAVLHTDLNTLLLEHRIDNYKNFREIEKQIWNTIELRDYKELNVVAKHLTELLDTNMNEYYSIRCRQLLLYVEGVIIRNTDHDYSLAIDRLITALKLSICDYEVDNYETYKYKAFDLLLLMNVAVNILATNKDKGYHILLFCYNFYNEHIPNAHLGLYEKICVNLSSLSYDLGLYKDALEYSSAGIEYCQKHRIYNFIGVLYIVKGACEQILGKETAFKTLLAGKHFLELADQHETLRDVVIQCKALYDIDL